MMCFVFALFAFAPILANAATRIVGGMDANPQRYPYYVLIEKHLTSADGNKTIVECGGSLM